MASLYLTIPSYPDPQAPGQTFDAVAKIGSLAADFVTMRGRVTLAVYRTSAAMAAGAPPVDTLIIPDGGRVLRPGPRLGATFPDLAAIQAANPDAWAAIWQYLLGAAVTLDGLTGATVTVGP